MTYELYGQRIELHFDNSSVASLLSQYQTKKKPTIHIYLNWMPFDAFVLAMIHTNEGISYAINYETKEVYLRTQSKTFDHEIIIKGLSHVIRALSFLFNLVPLKQDVYYKNQIMYIGYTHKLNNVEKYLKFRYGMIGKHNKKILIFPNVISDKHQAANYIVKEIHILDDMPFQIDHLEAMLYVMPYFELPRKSSDLKIFQDLLKTIKTIPKQMI